MDSKEYTENSKLLARVIIDAYKKPADQFDDLEEQVIGAFTFGAHRMFSMQEARVPEWQSKLAMVELLHDVFGFEMEIAGNALEYFVDCIDPKFNEVMHNVIVCGADAYPMLGDPEALGTALRKIVAIMSEKLEVTDE